MSLDIGKVAIALLGLLAYKNRDKIGELIAGRDSTDPKSAGSPGVSAISWTASEMLGRVIKLILGSVLDQIAPFSETRSRRRSTRKR